MSVKRSRDYHGRYAPEKTPFPLEKMEVMDGVLKIPLTQGKFALIDACDEYLAHYKWRFHNNYARGECQGKLIYFHHMIIGRPLNGFHVDHINGDTLDNRRANLRVVSARVNAQNARVHRNGKLPGTRLAHGKYWWSAIRVNGRVVYIGSFKTEHDAHAAYMTKCKELMGAREEALSRSREVEG